MRFTVIIPTYNHGSLINYAISSVLNQTLQDFEIFIVGDGVPIPLKGIMREWEKKDHRIHFLDYPKAANYGETNRNRALQKARGEAVCYLSDDDLWFPDHLEEVSRLLKNANFCHSLLFKVHANGRILTTIIDISKKIYQQLLLEGTSFIALSFAAHRLSLYEKLPYGWRATPKRIFTDLFMWQQFLSNDGCKPMSGFLPTVINLPASERKSWSKKKRIAELETWNKKLKSPMFVTKIRKKISDLVIRDQAIANARVHELTKSLEKIDNTKTWRLHESVLNSAPARFWRKLFK